MLIQNLQQPEKGLHQLNINTR